jgi:phosphoglycolate phosphatase-like HAD superfamily hydrolase
VFENHIPSHDHLIAIDSDGCAFDSMELKHKECFIPNIIQHWKLQPISRYARQTSEFVNLYSRWRGVNRFPALIKTFELLRERPEVKRLDFEVPDISSIERWVEQESTLSNNTLGPYTEGQHDPILDQALSWSLEANERVARVVRGDAPPFPMLKECLNKASGKADIMVCSATPHDTLVQEWAKHGIDERVFAICGQEQGSKKEILSGLAGTHYSPSNIIMIGDSPKDFDAAVKNGTRFYPINAGIEIESWQRFYDEALDKFLANEYDDAYQKTLTDEFLGYLPETPPWEVV